MNISKLMSVSVFGVIALALLPGNVCADNADVLPKGRFSFGVDYKHYLPWSERYDKNGNVQNAATDFNGALNSNVFGSLNFFKNPVIPGLITLGSPLYAALKEDNPNLGITVASFKYSYDRIEPSLAYGIFDSLSVGVKVPYIWYKNEVTAKIDSTSANMGLNPGTIPGLPASVMPFIPTKAGGRPLSNEDMQNILGAGVPGFKGLGFKRFETWENEGLGDIEAGFKYQYFKNDNWRLAGGAGAVFPTGKQEDQDNLVDASLGGGSYALMLRSYNDFIGLKNTVVNATAYYSHPFSQDREMRIYLDPHQPLVATKKNVTINPGDTVEFETSVNYQFNDNPIIKGTSIEVLYHYSKTFSSSVPDAPTLEKESGGYEHIFISRLAYSTFSLYKEGKFPVPMSFSLGYRNRFAGNNGAFKTEYIQTGISVFF